MNYSNKIKLADFFVGIAHQTYCIIKLDKNFPNYHRNSDIDIFCYDIIQMTREILKFGNEYANKGFKIIVNEVSEDHVHVDFYAPNDKKLEFRFDLMQSLAGYKKINVKPALFSSILENRVSVKQHKIDLCVPSQIDNFLIRYIEFIEYYDTRADKIKHADYINESASNLDKKVMLDKLHFYTCLPFYGNDNHKIESSVNCAKPRVPNTKLSLKELRRRIIQIKMKKDRKLIKIFGFYLFRKLK